MYHVIIRFYLFVRSLFFNNNHLDVNPLFKTISTFTDVEDPDIEDPDLIPDELDFEEEIENKTYIGEVTMGNEQQVHFEWTISEQIITMKVNCSADMNYLCQIWHGAPMAFLKNT